MQASGLPVVNKTTLATHLKQLEQMSPENGVNENMHPNAKADAVNAPTKTLTAISIDSDAGSPLNGHLQRAPEQRPPASAGSFATRLEILPCAHSQPQRHLYMKPADVAAAIDARIERMARKWTDNSASLKYSQLAHPGQLNPDPVAVIGRIVCDTDAPLNASSLLLESSRALASGYRVPLDVSAVKMASRTFVLFPGQIVLLEGVNPDGKCFKASRIIQSTGGWLMQIPRLPESYADYSQFDTGVLSFMSASGPFSPSDCINFRALSQILAMAIARQPEVLHLSGPFVDYQAEYLMEELPDRVFKQEVVQRLREFATQSPRTRLILSPSIRDAMSGCDPVFPQPTPNWDISELRATILPNPAVFFINEVCFAVGNNDILGAIATDSIPVGHGRDAASGLCASILHQGSLYPVAPSTASGCVDYTRWEQLELLFAPDVLLLPSQSVPALARTVPEDNCIVVNASHGQAALITINAPLANGGDSVDRRASRIRVDFIQG